MTHALVHHVPFLEVAGGHDGRHSCDRLCDMVKVKGFGQVQSSSSSFDVNQKEM